jgi:hypothetical protein
MEETKKLTQKFVELLESSSNEESFLETIKLLNRKCTQGNQHQNFILSNEKFLQSLESVFSGQSTGDIPISSFLKLLANTIVQNLEGQKIVWFRFGTVIERWLETSDSMANISWMIVHNISLGSENLLDHPKLLETGLAVIERCMKEESDPLPDFLGYFLDSLICESKNVKDLYQGLNENQQMIFLHYILDYEKNESNQEKLEESLIKHLSLEFKKSSDCILKTVTSYVDQVNPEKVVILLEIISTMSGQEKYSTTLKKDASLFLNFCLVLQNLQKLGKNNDNIFTPIQKLEAIAPSSNTDMDHEKEFSYNFKTMLVKTIANLCHQNKRNQELAREMEILMSIFDCTNADARNPCEYF